MSERLSALSWSIPVGRVFLTQVRVSMLFVPLGAALMLLWGFLPGLTFTALLIVAVLMHELAMVATARGTGGVADSVLIWPLGGIDLPEPGYGTWNAILVGLSGQLASLLMCFIFFPAFYAPEMLGDALNPAAWPLTSVQASHGGRNFLLLAFQANWLVFLVNWIPSIPMTTGRILLLLSQRVSAEVGHRLVGTLGLAFSWVLVFAGVLGQWPWLVALGAITLTLNHLLVSHLPAHDSGDESFLGYDFSEGYTSLEGANDSPTTPRPTWWQQWRERRQKQRAELEQRQRAELAEQVDGLLAKVHEFGMDALSASERQFLQRASESLRGRDKNSRP